MLQKLSPELGATVRRLTNSMIIRTVPFFRNAGERFIGEVLQVGIRPPPAPLPPAPPAPPSSPPSPPSPPSPLLVSHRALGACRLRRCSA